MKRYLFLLLICICSLNINAQEHMKFMGVSISGDLKHFISKMETIGFVPNSEFNNCNTDINTYYMDGKFTGQNCTILITTTPISHIVAKISIFSNEYTSWKLIKNDFHNYINEYSKKYGTFNTTEKFDYPNFDGDGLEIQALKMNRCHYLARHQGSLGTIVIQLASLCSLCKITFHYLDMINGTKLENEQNKIIRRDI